MKLAKSLGVGPKGSPLKSISSPAVITLIPWSAKSIATSTILSSKYVVIHHKYMTINS